MFGSKEVKAVGEVERGTGISYRRPRLSVRFGRTFLFHPSGTRAVIEEQVAQRLAQKMSPEEILDHCAQLRLRTERYRHVDPVRVYRAANEELPSSGDI